MTSFEDGPARGAVLELRRAPIFLRVTKDGDKIDALDLPDDVPTKIETLHAYVLAEVPTRGFIRRTGGGGAIMFARYKSAEYQPAQEVMRDRARWAVWCHENVSSVPPPVLTAYLR